ncbi:MAG: ArsC family (seleno)protein [Pseudomonadota bacterium]
MSCKKAQQFFEHKKIIIANKTDARKERIDADQAWVILSEGKQVYIGKGKKNLQFEPTQKNKEEILKAAMGPSGNLRAPTLKIKGNLYVGFNEALYIDL